MGHIKYIASHSIARANLKKKAKKSWLSTKGGFFSESAICFSNLQISQKKYSKKLFWAWNLNFPPIIANTKFKFQAQDSFLEYSFWRFWDLKKRSLFLKKSHLYHIIKVHTQEAKICIKFSKTVFYQVNLVSQCNVYIFCAYFY